MSSAKHADNKFSLVAGLRKALEAVRTHYGDGYRVNLRALVSDKTFCAFLAASFSSFGAISLYDFLRLAAKRRAQKLLGPSEPCGSKQSDKKKKKKTGGERVTTGAKFWKDLWTLFKIFAPHPFSRGARLLVAQFFLLVMKTLVTVRCSKLCVYFLTRAIAQASWKYWVRWIVNFAGWTIGGVVVNSGLKYTEALIELEMRLRLTKHAHTKYMLKNNFYAAAAMRRTEGLDNPDQRIVADISHLSHKFAHLYGHSFTPVLNFLLSLGEASKDLGFSRPMALILWNSLASVVFRSLSPSIGTMVAREQALEGNFRRSHGRLLSHAEEVAFLKGAETERRLLDRSLDTLTDAKGWHSLVKVRKDLADQLFKFHNLLAGGVFIHIPFLMSTHLSEAERISAFRSTEELMLRCGGAFSDVVLIGRKIDELAGYTHRIMVLFRALNAAKEPPQPAAGEWADSSGGSGEFSFAKVSIHAPESHGTSRLLLHNFDLQVIEGQNVLVTGPNGCGKTSLFRVLAGLWPPADGKVTCPLANLTWLPQKPYLVVGTLRDQITYPQQRGFDTADDAEIQRCLALAGVDHLAASPQGLDVLHDEWDEVLSGGERQRVGFARLYFHKPKFAVLDEATSAINPDEETQLYANIGEASSSRTTVFSIAHRLELRKFHQIELAIKGDGTGEWSRIPCT